MKKCKHRLLRVSKNENYPIHTTVPTHILTVTHANTCTSLPHIKAGAGAVLLTDESVSVSKEQGAQRQLSRHKVLTWNSSLCFTLSLFFLSSPHPASAGVSLPPSFHYGWSVHLFMSQSFILRSGAPTLEVGVTRMKLQVIEKELNSTPLSNIGENEKQSVVV